MMQNPYKLLPCSPLISKRSGTVTTAVIHYYQFALNRIAPESIQDVHNAGIKTEFLVKRGHDNSYQIFMHRPDCPDTRDDKIISDKIGMTRRVGQIPEVAIDFIHAAVSATIVRIEMPRHHRQ